MRDFRILKAAIFAGTAALALCSTIAPAAAGAISSDTWYTFGFQDPGSALGAPYVTGYDPTSLAAPDQPWTITLSAPEYLRITDLETSGDYFTLSDFGILLGTSGTGVPSASSGCAEDISCALADSNYGKGVFYLAAGSHSITGVYDGVITHGDGAFIVQATPEPITVSLFGAGLAGAVAMRRRKKKAA